MIAENEAIKWLGCDKPYYIVTKDGLVICNFEHTHYIQKDKYGYSFAAKRYLKNAYFDMSDAIERLIYIIENPIITTTKD